MDQGQEDPYAPHQEPGHAVVGYLVDPAGTLTRRAVKPRQLETVSDPQLSAAAQHAQISIYSALSVVALADL